MLKKILTASVAVLLLSSSAITFAHDNNTAPKAEDITIKSAPTVSVSGTVPVYDAGGDAIKAIIVSKPQKGELTFTNGADYTYTPFPNESGKDSFTCVFTDSKGLVSNYVNADITIEPSIYMSYADMNNNPAHYSAIKLAEKDIYTGEKVGNSYYFHPTKKLNKYEFILMTLSAIGEKEFSPCVNTKLKNDGQIKNYQKPAIMRAIELNIIKRDTFNPNDTLTNAEAVVFIDRASKIENVSHTSLKLSDKEKIPQYAMQSYMNLYAYKMLDQSKASPNKLVTKATASDLVWQLYKLHTAEKTK